MPVGDHTAVNLITETGKKKTLMLTDYSSKENKMSRKRSDDNGLTTVRGLITPVDWDDKGSVIGLAIETFDEDQYLLEHTEKIRELLSVLREEVEVSGEVRKAKGKKIIKVRRYNLKPSRECFGNGFQTQK